MGTTLVMQNWASSFSSNGEIMEDRESGTQQLPDQVASSEQGTPPSGLVERAVEIVVAELEQQVLSHSALIGRLRAVFAALQSGRRR